MTSESGGGRGIGARLALLAFTTALAVEPGSMNSVDTKTRLAVAHELWTGEAPDLVAESGGMPLGVLGPDGRYKAWFGIGQSLALLPADLVATAATRALRLDPGRVTILRPFLVAFLTFPLITTGSVLLAFALLRELRFSGRAAALGAMALLFATTFLKYAQDHQENSLILLTALAAAFGLFRWLDTGRLLPLWLGAAALGFLILIRLPLVFDVAVIGLLFLALAWGWSRREGTPPASRLVPYILVMGAVLALFVGLERLYQYHRFATLGGTYTSGAIETFRRYYRDVPDGYPFIGPWRDGLLGPLISPHKSIFLFDPLLGLTLAVLATRWRRTSPEVRAWVLAFLVLLAVEITFYARCVFWHGDDAWGDRYLLVAVWLASLVGVPLVVDDIGRSARSWRVLTAVVVAVSVVVQLASAVLPASIEPIQRKCLGYRPWEVDTSPPMFVIGRRFENLALLASGRALRPDDSCEARFLLEHIQINLAPFRRGDPSRPDPIPRPARAAMIVGWLALLAAIPWQIRGVIRATDDTPTPEAV